MAYQGKDQEGIIPTKGLDHEDSDRESSTYEHIAQDQQGHGFCEQRLDLVRYSPHVW